jgi:hypothetical protein
MNEIDHPSDDIPDWAWNIVDKHDLACRTDSPLAAATVLLVDAGMLLAEIGATVFREQAITPLAKQRLTTVTAMLSDAGRLSALCDEVPTVGVVSTARDGMKTWAPAAR